MALKDEIKKQATKTRTRRRVPLNGRNVLTVDGKDPNFRYRVVNDEGSRVEILKERGYEVVEARSVRIGDRRVATPGAEGTVATAHVGGGLKGVVMRIPNEWYEEDMAEKQAYVDELERATKSAKSGDYGKISIEKDK